MTSLIVEPQILKSCRQAGWGEAKRHFPERRVTAGGSTRWDEDFSERHSLMTALSKASESSAVNGLWNRASRRGPPHRILAAVRPCDAPSASCGLWLP